MPKEALNKVYHVINIPEKEQAFIRERIDDALEVERLKVLIRPVTATLGNPIAFPIIFGLVALGIGVYILARVFPKGPTPEEILGGIKWAGPWAVSEVEKLAGEIAEVINAPLPDIPGVVDLEAARQTLVRGTRDLLLKLWEGITKLPPIL